MVKSREIKILSLAICSVESVRARMYDRSKIGREEAPDFQLPFSSNETCQLVVYKSPKINTGAQLGIGLSLASHVGVDRSEVSN